MKGGGCGVVKAELALFSVDPASHLATPTRESLYFSQFERNL